MLACMANSQLAVRFTARQLQTLDALARRSNTTRSAVVKRLVDEAEKELIAASYASGYPKRADRTDGFGDLAEFHAQSEAERVAARAEQADW
jgi:hypothetical protein